jgi:hypothetical protein
LFIFLSDNFFYNFLYTFVKPFSFYPYIYDGFYKGRFSYAFLIDFEEPDNIRFIYGSLN